MAKLVVPSIPALEQASELLAVIECKELETYIARPKPNSWRNGVPISPSRGMSDRSGQLRIRELHWQFSILDQQGAPGGECRQRVYISVRQAPRYMIYPVIYG